MSSASVAALVMVMTLAAVLLVSGAAKLRDPRAVADSFGSLRVPALVPRGPAAAALPWVEVALGVLLLLLPSPWVVPVAVAVAGLMLTYTALVARALGFDEPVTCSCFGRLGRHHVDRLTLARNVVLSVLALLVVWWTWRGGSAPHAVGELTATGWWTLVATAAAVAVAVLIAGGGSTPPAPVGELLDYERRPIPYGVLTTPGGSSVTLNELAAVQARLIVLLNPHCGPCDRIALRLDDWAARLEPSVGVIAAYSLEPNEAAHADDLVMVEPELNVRRGFAVGTPSAVLLGADGLLAGGPVSGEDAVAEFVEEVVDELASAAETLDLPEA